MSVHKRIVSVVVGSMLFLVQTSVSTLQSPASPVQQNDPAVDAHVTFVDGKRLEVPVDRAFVVAALDRLVIRRLEDHRAASCVAVGSMRIS